MKKIDLNQLDFYFRNTILAETIFCGDFEKIIVERVIKESDVEYIFDFISELSIIEKYETNFIESINVIIEKSNSVHRVNGFRLNDKLVGIFSTVLYLSKFFKCSHPLIEQILSYKETNKYFVF